MNVRANWIIMFTLLMGCNTTTKDTEIKSPPSEQMEATLEVTTDTLPRVTGIGGIFFKTNDPEAVKIWYGQNLGLAIDDFGSPFEFRNANNPEERNYLRWSPHGADSDYFDPSEKAYMINYRVQHLEALIEKLKSNGVTILDSMVTYDYGKFIHIMDLEGNKIELWEPNDSFLTQLGGPTTK